MDVARHGIHRGGVPSEVHKCQSHKEDDVEDGEDDVGTLQINPIYLRKNLNIINILVNIINIIKYY